MSELQLALVIDVLKFWWNICLFWI